MVLNSYHKGCPYEMKEERGPPHKKEYVFGVTVLGVEYLGRGNSKKLAKQAAASSALRSLYSLRLNLDAGASAMQGSLRYYCVRTSSNAERPDWNLVHWPYIFIVQDRYLDLGTGTHSQF